MDSTCAINNAVAFAGTQCNQDACPALYVPGGGCFLISSAIRIPSNIGLFGDGTGSSCLEVYGTSASPNSSNLLTFTTPVAPIAFFFGATVRDITLQGSGQYSTGTLLESQTTTPLTLQNVQFLNHGGIGFAGLETSERTRLNNMQFQYVRWPELIGGYEYREENFTSVYSGCASPTYCYDINAVNGVDPGPLPTANYTLVSATGSGSSAAYVFSGSQTGYAAGVSPLAVGNVLYVSGVTGVTGLNAPANQGWIVDTVTNNSPTSGEFRLAVSHSPLGQIISASGSGTVGSAVFATALLPDNRHAAVWVGGGYEQRFIGNEPKQGNHLAAFKIMQADNLDIENSYAEGWGSGAQAIPSPVQSDILFSGLPDQLIANGTLQTSSASACVSGGFPCISVTPATEMWWPGTVGVASDIPDVDFVIGYNFGPAYIFCADFVAGSTSPCTSNPGVQQGQWEEATVVVAQDTGLAYLTARNLSGSTAPSNTTWVNPVIDLPANFGLSTSTGLSTKNNSWATFNPPSISSGYVPYSVDGSIYETATGHTSMDDGYIHYAGGANAVGTNIGVTSAWTYQDLIASGQPEIPGFLWIKNDSRLALICPLCSSGLASEVSGVSATGASPLASPDLPELTNTNTSALLTVQTPHKIISNYPSDQYFAQELAAYGNPAGLYGNPGNPTGGVFLGKQYSNSYCSASTDSIVASFTGSVSGTTLTVTGTVAGVITVSTTPLSDFGQNLTAGTYITAEGTGTGGDGTYTVNNSQTISARTMTQGHAANLFCLRGSANVYGAGVAQYSWAGTGYYPSWDSAGVPMVANGSAARCRGTFGHYDR